MQCSISRGVGLGDDLRRIRSVADYQFGRGVGVNLFPDRVEIFHSKRTGRVRYVYLDGKRLVTMRPTDGLFSLSIEGAKRIADSMSSVKCSVVIRDDVAEFVIDGGDVFAVHVVGVDDNVRAKDEVVVLDEKGRVLAVGRAVLSAGEMRAFKKGIAVKVRRGCGKEG
jgi:predicted RNA-binding protein (TIGR00451 family)